MVSALLLSMLTDSGPQIDERDTSILVQDINNRAERILQQQRKQGFNDHIRLPLPAAEDNHVKLRSALVETLQDLRGLNIHSAMRSGADWLGTFYEVFLKYARWAQDLGIVLTPRHITRFAARAVGIGANDIVYDPTCGTGGFLVAAFEEVKRNCGVEQIDEFKRNSVFGLEQDDGIAALAIVNMIFRGDGKNNIEQANCLAQNLIPKSGNNGIRTATFSKEKSKRPPVTRVLMNPPFSLKRDKEYAFVDHALNQMVQGGILFSILPYSVMAKSGAAKTWRENLLKKHTLLSVITLPIDIFYPVSCPPVGIFVKQGIPHEKQNKVLWVRAETDGHLKSNKKRLPSNLTTNQLKDCLPIVRSFLDNPGISVDSKPRFIISTPVNFKDDLFELVPEVYLEQEKPCLSNLLDRINSVMGDASAFLVRNFLDKLLKVNFSLHKNSSFTNDLEIDSMEWAEFRLDKLFTLNRGNFHSLKHLANGNIVTVSRTEINNGVVGYLEQPEGSTLHSPGRITVSTVTGDAFVQVAIFQATDNVIVCEPKKPMRPTSSYFIAAMINRQKWRYSYGRQPYKGKLSKLSISLPVVSGNINEDIIKKIVEQNPYWCFLSEAGQENTHCSSLQVRH